MSERWEAVGPGVTEELELEAPCSGRGSQATTVLMPGAPQNYWAGVEECLALGGNMAEPTSQQAN